MVNFNKYRQSKKNSNSYFLVKILTCPNFLSVRASTDVKSGQNSNQNLVKIRSEDEQNLTTLTVHTIRLSTYTLVLIRTHYLNPAVPLCRDDLPKKNDQLSTVLIGPKKLLHFLRNPSYTLSCATINVNKYLDCNRYQIFPFLSIFYSQAVRTNLLFIFLSRPMKSEPFPNIFWTEEPKIRNKIQILSIS